MAREVQEPVATEVSEPGHHGIHYTHPAFAQIGASRVEGSTTLFGSDFKHQRYIRISICPSTLKRSLSEDWYHGSTRKFIEVDLSEAQWATFVSSMNVGHGVPCTLRYKDGESIPGLPDPQSRTDQFAAEARAKMARGIDGLKDVEALVGASGLSQKKQAEILSALSRARTDLTGNLAFVAEQFGEHMERTVEAAKVEVNAYAQGLVMRTGLAALSGAQAPVLELAYSGERHEQPAPQDPA